MANLIMSAEIDGSKATGQSGANSLDRVETTLKNFNAKCGEDYGEYSSAIVIDKDGNVSLHNGNAKQGPDATDKNQSLGNVNDMVVSQELHKLAIDTGIVLYYDVDYYEIFVDKISSFDSQTIFVPVNL